MSCRRPQPWQKAFCVAPPMVLGGRPQAMRERRNGRGRDWAKQDRFAGACSSRYELEVSPKRQPGPRDTKFYGALKLAKTLKLRCCVLKVGGQPGRGQRMHGVSVTGGARRNTRRRARLFAQQSAANTMPRKRKSDRQTRKRMAIPSGVISGCFANWMPD